MKKFFLFAILFVGCMCVCSCGSDDPETGGNTTDDSSVTLSPSSIETTALGGTYTVNVTTSAKEWSAIAYDDCSTWVKVTPNAQAGTITIVVSKNDTDASREGTVYYKSGVNRKAVTVKQSAPLAIDKNSIYFTSEAGVDTVTVSGVTNWTATASESWIKTSKNGDKLCISVEANTNITRTGTITISTADESATVEITQAAAGDSDVTPPTGYTLANLVWHDEFNSGTSLNTSDWTHEHQSAGWVNNELQTYTSGAKQGYDANGQKKNINITEIQDGHLNINCFNGTDGKIYSGRVYAKVSTGWTYGYFEARIKLPKGKGTWPAWWMMPANNNYSSNPWPGCGEIDIMEEVGVDANYVSSTIHCNKYNNGGSSTEHGSKYVSTAESEFHTYGCEWTESYLQFFVDGVSILKYAPSSKTKDYWPFNVPFYPILNLAWGGSWGGYKGVDSSALPVQMQVDWVRIWQK